MNILMKLVGILLGFVIGTYAILFITEGAEDKQAVAASWYGDEFGGGPLACYQEHVPYDPTDAFTTAASPDFPCGQWLLVEYGGKIVIVQVRDRGILGARGRLDLSQAAFERLADKGVGVLSVSIRILEP